MWDIASVEAGSDLVWHASGGHPNVSSKDGWFELTEAQLAKLARHVPSVRAIGITNLRRDYVPDAPSVVGAALATLVAPFATWRTASARSFVPSGRKRNTPSAPENPVAV